MYDRHNLLIPAIIYNERQKTEEKGANKGKKKTKRKRKTKVSCDPLRYTRQYKTLKYKNIT